MLADLTNLKKVVVSLGMGLMLLVNACGGGQNLPAVALVEQGQEVGGPPYRIGPGDSLQIFVWRNEELTTDVTVRPDGRLSVPLLEDLLATGKTPTQLAREIERKLGEYIQDPLVTVIVTGFLGPFSQQVRVVGEAAEPKAIAYVADMTMLDVMISVGGLNEFADGNRAKLIRLVDGQQKEYRVRLDSLLKDGDILANVTILPGDVVIIPESFF